MSLVVARDDSASLDALIRALNIEDRLPTDWQAQASTALKDTSDKQLEFASQFYTYIADAKGLEHTQTLECFVTRFGDSARAAVSTPVPLSTLYDVLPLEALDKDPRGVARALATLKNTVAEKLRPIVDICIALADSGLDTDNDYVLASRVLGAIDEISKRAAALVGGSLKSSADPATLIGLIDDNVRAITELYNTVPRTNVARLTGSRTLPDTLLSSAHMSIADFICHSSANGKTGGFIRSLLVYFGFGTSIVLVRALWLVYAAYLEFENLAALYQQNQVLLSSGMAFLGVGEYTKLEDVPRHARYATGWNLLEKTCGVNVETGLIDIQLGCMTTRTPQPPEFLQQRARFYATTAAYTGQLIRETIGFSGFAQLLIVGYSIIYVYRNFDSIFNTQERLRVAAPPSDNQLSLPPARSVSPQRRIGPPPSARKTPIEEPLDEQPQKSPIGGASRSRTPPRDDERPRRRRAPRLGD